MKKLNFLADEILNREDLRHVVGGLAYGGGECRGISQNDCPNHTCSSYDGNYKGKCAWNVEGGNKCVCSFISAE